MHNSIDSNRSFDPGSPELDMALLQELLRQQAQRRPLYENIAILGCGYVGGALAAHWDAQGHFVTGTTTSRDRVSLISEVASKVAVVTGEDAAAVESLVHDQDTVVVSVAPTGFRVADEGTYEATYLGTAKTLLQALNQAPRVKRLIYISSCAVYGDRQGDWVDETAPIFPTDSRTQVLYEAERIMAQAASRDRSVCIFRLGGIYGPGRELAGMFGGMAGMTVPGKGDRVINWTHLDDIVSAVDFARIHELNGVYNLVDDSELTVREQVKRVCDQYGLAPVHWDPSQPSLRRKSLRVRNQKLKAAGYQLVHPQLLV